MNSSFANSNGLAGLSGSVMPTKEQKRKIAWKIAREAKRTNHSLVQIAGAQINYGWHGRGKYGQWKAYWQTFSSHAPTQDTAYKVANTFKRQFPEVFNTHPPSTYTPKYANGSGGQSSQGTGSSSTNDTSQSSGGDSSAGGSQSVHTTKKSGSTWLGLAALAAAVGGGIWYFGEGDYPTKENKSKTK